MPPTFVSAHWSLDAYASLLTHKPVARYFLNSLIVAVGSTLLSVTLAALAAIADVVEEPADDEAEGDGHHGEIGTAHPQRRNSQQDAGQSGDRDQE